jgi:hypothetical protein
VERNEELNGGVSGERTLPVLQEWVGGESHSTKRCNPKPPYEIVGVRGTPKKSINNK